MTYKFNREDLDFYLPDNFRGLSKEYTLDVIFNKGIQNTWQPRVGDFIVGCTGNIFVISGHHHSVPELGGDKFFFGGGLCNRDGGNVLNSTYCFILNKDGMEYYYNEKGEIKKRKNLYYSKFSDFRYLPHPHEIFKN